MSTYPNENHLAPYDTALSPTAEIWMREQIGDQRYSAKRISTYEDLNSLLEPLRQDGSGLVFRGQAAEEWELYSKYERALQQGKKAQEDTSRVRSHPAGKIHDPALIRFKKNVGIPENQHQWDGQLISMLQHYGAPTTLLDWTESIDIALFFATQFAAPPQTEYATIFIVDSQKVNRDIERENEFKPPFGSKFYRPNLFFDLRMRAQKGLFSIPPLRGLQSLFPVALDRAIEVASDGPPNQVLVKIHFSRKLCHQITRDLQKRGVTWDTVFPPATMEDLCRIVEQQVFNEINTTSDVE